MATIAKLYPLLKEMGPDDRKSQEFIETIEESFEYSLEQKIKSLATKEDIANLKIDMIKWAIGLLLGQTALILTIIRLFFMK